MVSAGFGRAPRCLATHVELKPKAADQLMNAAGAEQVIDKSIWVGRSEKPDGSNDEPPARAKPRARKPGPKGKSKPYQKRGDKSFAKKTKKPRTGRKKPRGPNGEKKRSPKKKFTPK